MNVEEVNECTEECQRLEQVLKDEGYDVKLLSIKKLELYGYYNLGVIDETYDIRSERYLTDYYTHLTSLNTK